jgi:hypothetical protein
MTPIQAMTRTGNDPENHFTSRSSIFHVLPPIKSLQSDSIKHVYGESPINSNQTLYGQRGQIFYRNKKKRGGLRPVFLVAATDALAQEP